MIEDQTLGLKVAENDEEAFWAKMKEKCEKEIANNKREIIINEYLVALCEEKLKTKGL